MASFVRAFIFGIIIIVVVSQPIIFNGLFTFIFAGVVPGTDISLPFWAMSLVLATIAFVAIKWVRKEPLYIGDTIHEAQLNKRQAREYVLQKASAKPTVSSRRPLFKRRKRAYRVATS